jgi:predicted RNA binding protein YcfA (HicA-like mRNA interferase family)
MAKPTKRGKQKMPPLSAADIIRVLRADGWVQVPGTKHLAFEHPTKTGKVNVDEKWEHVRLGDWVCRSVLEQASMTRAEFEELYWKTR